MINLSDEEQNSNTSDLENNDNQNINNLKENDQLSKHECIFIKWRYYY